MESYIRKKRLHFFPCICVAFFTNAVGVSSFPEIWPPQQLNTYDFIIVGGGTAGCALSNRLSANGKHSVLLLEAGGVPPEFMNILGLAKQNQQIPELTFQYVSVPQRYGGLGIDGGVHKVPLGRLLGGTSQINYNVFNRGSPYDYDNWANLTGDSSWKYENMLKYFRRSETYLGQFPSFTQHGQNGPIPVSHQEYAPGRSEFLAAGRELGYQIWDANGPQKISFNPIEFSRRNGRRVSSYEGYLRPIMNSRSNLKVITHAYTTRIIFEGSTAIGVRYNADGTNSSTSPTSTVVYARREIILSAGTYGSAMLLMKSGIGPRNVLRPANIQIIKELPVGEGFQEHPEVAMHFILGNKSLALNPETDFNARNFQLFRQFGTGPYTSVAGYSAQAFLASSLAARAGHPEWPDILLTLTSVASIQPTYRNYSMQPWETSTLLNLYLGRGRSRGTVKLNPTNIDAMPLIDFNYLGDARDVDILLEAVDVSLKLFEETETYRQVGARFPPNGVPACDHLKYRSRAYWRCVIIETLIPGNHPAGTCGMNSVVDSKLRVIGLNKLRVVDASIMPVITNSNLHAAVYGIAEKASEDILLDNQ